MSRGGAGSAISRATTWAGTMRAMREQLLNEVLQVHAVGIEPRDQVDCAVDVAGVTPAG